MARREDKEIRELLDQFVCVRVIQMYGVDLSLFQFDYRLTWSVFFMNSDKTIYGRYGVRSSWKADTDVSLKGFKEALRGALEIHKAYPENRESLAGKTGSAPKWDRPEKIPTLGRRFKGKISVRENRIGGCIHCHMIPSGRWDSLEQAGEKDLPDEIVWGYPLPSWIGLKLDRDTRATVTGVEGKSAAAGIRKGDRILSMNGQPILSTADVIWALREVKISGDMKFVVDRDGDRKELTIALEKGWQEKGEFAWGEGFGRAARSRSGFHCEPLSGEDRKKLSIGESELALRVKAVAPGWVKDKPRRVRELVRKGDIVVGVDGKTEAMSLSRFVLYLYRNKRSGDTLKVTLLRGGERVEVALKLR